MDYAIEPRLQKLNNDIQQAESRLLEDIKRRESSIQAAVTTIKADVNKSLKQNLNEFKDLKSEIQQSQKKFEFDVKEYLDC